MNRNHVFFKLEGSKSILATIATCSLISFTNRAKGAEAAANAKGEVSGCIFLLHSPSQLAVTQRLELSTDWVESKSKHQSQGSAKFNFSDKIFNVAGEFSYISLGKIDSKNRRFEQGESKLAFSVNGYSGRSPVNTHHSLDAYMEGVFYPSKTSRKLEFLYWSPSTIDFIKTENPQFYLIAFCTPRYNQGKTQRLDTIYLK